MTDCIWFEHFLAQTFPQMFAKNEVCCHLQNNSLDVYLPVNMQPLIQDLLHGHPVMFALLNFSFHTEQVDHFECQQQFDEPVHCAKLGETSIMVEILRTVPQFSDDYDQRSEELRVFIHDMVLNDTICSLNIVWSE